MAARKISFTVTDERSGRQSLVEFEQYSTFVKRCKEKFYYPLGTDIVFELENGDIELDESAFECLGNMTKLKIRRKHGPTSSHPCDQKPDGEQEPRQKERTGWKRIILRSITESNSLKWFNLKNITGAEYVRIQLEKGNIDQLKDILEAAEKLTVQPLAIAVTGSSGQGKSLLINTLRDLRYSDDEGWAPVNETETEAECRAYKHPQYPNLVFWDVPGVGTKRFPRKEYLSAIKFDRYDFYIICSCTRYTEDDMWLVKEVKKRHKKCYFLRTKVDEDIKNAKHISRTEVPETVKLHEIRNECQNNLGNEHKVFLINSFEKNKYDFPVFIQTLLNDASKEQKRSLTLGLMSVSVEMIEKKAAYLKDDIWITASWSAVGAIITIPGISYAIDSHVVIKKIQEYQTQFELTNAHIKKYAESVGLSEEEFKKQCRLKLDFKVMYEEGIMYLIEHYGPGLTALDLSRYVPIIGSITGPVATLLATTQILETILDGCKHDAVTVFKFVIKQLYKLK